MTQLTAEKLVKRYGRRVLFSDLSLTVKSGEVVAITGSNGTGKSTLLRILGGLLTPTRGSVVLMLDGITIKDDERPLHAGLVAPYFEVYDDFTARENLRFIARARRMQQAASRIEALLDLVELAGRGDDYVSTYSSGMRQRVKMAVALLPEPGLLLLDEPSSNLDAAGREMVKRVIALQRARGRLVLLATNDAREVTWCDRELSVEAFR